MPAGRPQIADPGSLYAFAHLFYWDFRRLSEGSVRWRYDRKAQEQLAWQLEQENELSPEQKARAAEVADEEVRCGKIHESDREARRLDIEQSQLTVNVDQLHRVAAEATRKELRIPAEKDVVDVLLGLDTTAAKIRELCEEAVMSRFVPIGGEIREVQVSAWPLPPGSTFPTYLSQYAEQYVRALNDPRFPRCDVSSRPSNRLKQFWFLSRALAGALFGISTRTAINLIGSLRPEEVLEVSRNAKPLRRQRRKIISSRKNSKN